MSSWRDTGVNPSTFRRLPKFAAVISLISDQNLRFLYGSEYQSYTDMTVQQPLSQKHFQRSAMLITDDMKF